MAEPALSLRWRYDESIRATAKDANQADRCPKGPCTQAQDILEDYRGSWYVSLVYLTVQSHGHLCCQHPPKEEENPQYPNTEYVGFLDEDSELWVRVAMSVV